MIKLTRQRPVPRGTSLPAAADYIKRAVAYMDWQDERIASETAKREKAERERDELLRADTRLEPYSKVCP